MARLAKKSVYERIEDMLQSIKQTEELLATQNKELEALYLEKDDLEMKQLLNMMKSKGLTIDQALTLLENKENNSSSDKTKTKNIRI